MNKIILLLIVCFSLSVVKGAEDGYDEELARALAESLSFETPEEIERRNNAAIEAQEDARQRAFAEDLQIQDVLRISALEEQERISRAEAIAAENLRREQMRMQRTRGLNCDSHAIAKIDRDSNHILFGAIAPFFSASFGRFVFVGQYDYAAPNASVVVRLADDVNGTQRYIVAQAGLFNISDQNFALRVHAMIHPERPEVDVTSHVSIHVRAGDAVGLDDDNAEVVSHSTQNIGYLAEIPYFSPDNMHLGNLHPNAFANDEMYSFVSQLRVLGGLSVDTFHFLSNKDDVVLGSARGSMNFSDFIVALNSGAIASDPAFMSHIDKMVQFANGAL